MDIQAVDYISQSVIKVMGLNPSHRTLEGTNTFLLGTGNQRVLIDTGEGNLQYQEKLKEILSQQNCQIVAIFITHYHYDHAQGITDIIKIHGLENVKKNIKIYKFLHNMDQSLENEENFNYTYLQDQQIVNVSSEIEIKMHHIPGHTSDSSAFEFKDKCSGENYLFVGDCILGGCSTTVEDLKDQFESYGKILQIDFDHLMTGHGTFYKGKDISIKAIIENMNHRQNRENQILEALKKQEFLRNGAEILEILDVVYPGLDDGLKTSAFVNIQTHLNKLIREGRVTQLDEDKYFLSNQSKL